MPKINMQTYPSGSLSSQHLTAWEAGDVQRLKELDRLMAYSETTDAFSCYNFLKIPKQNLRVVVEYLLGSARLWSFTFEKLIPVFEELHEDTELMTKVIFQRTGSQFKSVSFLSWIEKDISRWHLLDLIGAAGLLTGEDIIHFTGAFHEKLVYAAYRQILTDRQITLRIIFESGVLLPRQVCEENRWIHVLLIANADRIDDVLHLAVSFAEIYEAVFVCIKQGTFTHLGTLIERLTKEERETLMNDLLLENRYLSEICTSESVMLMENIGVVMEQL